MLVRLLVREGPPTIRTWPKEASWRSLGASTSRADLPDRRVEPSELLGSSFTRGVLMRVCLLVCILKFGKELIELALT